MITKNYFKHENGYTLVELVWAAALAVLLLISIFGALQVGMRGANTSLKMTSFSDSGTSTMRVMSRYIRQAMVLSQTEDNYLRFSVERSQQDNVYSTVEFRIYNRSIYMIVDGREKVLARNIRNQDMNVPLLTYLGENYQVITDTTLRKSQSRSIVIQIIIDDDLNSEPAPLRLKETVSLRNFNI